MFIHLSVHLLSIHPFVHQSQVKKNNVLKDFLHVAGPLGVTHLLILSKTDVGTYLVRICIKYSHENSI